MATVTGSKRKSSIEADSVDVSGNITVGGTVDGRDVASDGAKLDGIEAGATADQTAAEIRDLLKTVDGAGSGVDADLLDGQHGSYYTGYTDTAIANLVASAPGTLDTLNELAAALGDDPNFSTTVTNSIAGKVSKSGDTMSGGLNIAGSVGIGTTTPAHSLHVYHTANYEALKIETNTGGALVRATDSSGTVEMGAQGGNWVARTGSTARIKATQAGNIEIGSSSQTGGNPSLSLYGYDTSASAAKYGRLQVASDGSFLVTAEDTYLQLSAANYIQSNKPHNFTSSILFSGDTNLYRTSANNLKTDDSFTVGTNLTVNGTTTHNGLTMTSGTNVDQLYTFTASSLQLSTSWQDVGISGSDLATGTYIIQMYIDSHDVGGTHYNEFYSGVMSWYAGSTNSTVSDEIVLSRAGHAPNAENVFLRVIRSVVGDPEDLRLQVSSTHNWTGIPADKPVFKFRRMI